MKKILSLLSVLTISGTSLPSVIAVSNYQKREESVLIENENTIKNKLFALNYDIENKQTEISDAREYYEKYSKLYAETRDIGYFNYSNNYRQQFKLFEKQLRSMENQKENYLKCLQNLNQYQ